MSTLVREVLAGTSVTRIRRSSGSSSFEILNLGPQSVWVALNDASLCVVGGCREIPAGRAWCIKSSRDIPYVTSLADQVTGYATIFKEYFSTQASADSRFTDAGNELTLVSPLDTLNIVSDEAESRDAPVGGITFQNLALDNNPKFLIGNPYTAGIGLPAYGIWFRDDTFAADEWRLIVSGENSGTFAAVLDGVRRSAFESFIQNGDFKPWMRIEASAQAFTCGAGGAKALAGNVVRAANVLTITTETEHKFGVGQKLWKTAIPGGTGETATFGTNDDLWGPGGTERFVASVVNANTFTVAYAAADATSTEDLIFSVETDTAFGRDEYGYAAVRVNDSSVARFNQYGISMPGGLSVLAEEEALPLGAEGVASTEVTAGMLHVLEGKTFYQQGTYRSTGWYNGGGETQTTQEVFLVGTGSGNKTTNLPSIAGRDWVRLMIKNMGEGGSNTLTVDADGSDTIEGAGTLVLAANAGVTLVSQGTNWVAFKHPA